MLRVWRVVRVCRDWGMLVMPMLSAMNNRRLVSWDSQAGRTRSGFAETLSSSKT